MIIDSKFSHLVWVNTPRKQRLTPQFPTPTAKTQTVILDPSSKVLAVYNHDAPVGRSVDEMLRIVQAFQYVAKHGEVCPANWKPGSKTMKGDVKLAQAEYFSKLK